MNNLLVEQMALLLASSIPLSIILAKQISRIFSKYDTSLEKTTTIVTDVLGILVKKDMEIKNLYFNNFKAHRHEKTAYLEIENSKTKEIKVVEKSHLKKEKSIEYAAISSYLCHYRKIAGIENVINDFFTKCGFNENLISEEYGKIQELPTDEVKKISTTVAIHIPTKEIFAFSKGNPRSLLHHCTRILIDGQKTELTYNMRLAFKKRIKRLNQHGHKVIAFAYKGLPLKRLANYTEEFAENDLILLGMVSLSSPVNTEMKEQMQLVRKLGIKTYILSTTKEKKTTGAAIELEVINPHYFETINNDYLKDLTDQKLGKMLENKDKDYIFTELKKEEISRIIKLLKDNGETVTVIDPKRHITFHKIMHAIKKYRIDKENEPKLTAHALSCKIAEICIIIASIFLRMPLPFSITLILFIEIFINLPLELAIKTSKPEADVMNKDYVLPKGVIPFGQLLWNGLIIGFIIIGIYIFNLLRYGWTIGDPAFINEEVIIRSITISFILLTISQIFNAYNVNNLNKSVFKLKTFANPYLLATTVIVILAAYTIINFFILKNYLDITIISLLEWEIIGFATLIMILAEEAKKYLIKTFFKQ
ncbi:MAG: cation transporting ATPase C-terminal domain-containing protein [Candidatus Gracilibacteria bacterium]